mgnify:CR=1 FL=1
MNYDKEQLNKVLSPLFQKQGVKLAYFFGSAARNAMGPLSDIDLAVLWPKTANAPMIKSLSLQREIQESLGEERFEVGSLNGQNLSFCYVVISSGQCIYGAAEDRVAYETEILGQYLDFNYLAEQYNQAFDQRVKEGKEHG